MNEEAHIERYVPEHPLPEEVRKMERDETVCKFCGVSYLIHNEIKALEDKLKLIQDELQHYKGSEAREELLKSQIITRDQTIQQLQNTINSKDTSMGKLAEDIESKDKELLRLRKVKDQVEDTLSQTSQNLEKFRSKHSFLMSNLPNVLSEVKHLRSHIQTVRAHQESYAPEITRDCKHLLTIVSDVCSKHATDQTAMKERMLELDNERISFKFKEEKYIQDIATYEAQYQKLLSQNNAEQGQLQAKYDQLWADYTELQAESKRGQERLNGCELEAVQYKEQIRQQTERLESLQSQIRQHEQVTEMNNIKQQKDLKEKENELQTVVRELGRMKRKFQEQQEDIEKKSSLSHLKAAELQEQVVRMRGDCEALKNEREMMITAHQNQIEQLRESFKRKLAQNDDWPEKLEEAIRKEKAKYSQELSALEAKLKENFIMELQIEKQKHQELLDRYKDDSRVDEKEVQERISVIKQQHRSEVSEFHKQLAENKARFRATENTLREEIQSLKKIIHDLEQRLGRLDAGTDTKSNELKYELKKLESELKEAKERSKQLENQLESTKEEVGFLQDTVRRECEERFELTEALAVAKEKLLTLQKPPGGYSQQQMVPRAPSSVSSTKSPESSRTVTSSEELAVFRKVSNRLPPSDKSKDFSSASAVTLGYNASDNSDSARNARSHRASSMSNSRDRIAQAVGRR